jgi:hypothetical protein
MARYLADWSALSRAPRHPEVRAALEPLWLRGDIATCGLVQLEHLYSTRGYNELLVTRQRMDRVYPTVPTTQADFDRALELMMELARRNRHRAVNIVDLVIAAVAERAGLIVLHYDADYEHIAQVTGQATEWVVPRGSVS